ncbi:MAG: hypothetical protein ACRDTF_13680, partial [Pseudonocardiaceae bacterium]
MAGVPPGPLLLNPPQCNLGPPGGEFGIDRGGDRFGGRGVDGLGDTRMDPVPHRGIRVGGVSGVGGDQGGGDQGGQRLSHGWGLAGLVQAPPQISPVPAESHRVPVGLLDPAQHLQQQPRWGGQSRGDVGGPRGEGPQ